LLLEYHLPIQCGLGKHQPVIKDLLLEYHLPIQCGLGKHQPVTGICATLPQRMHTRKESHIPSPPKSNM